MKAYYADHFVLPLPEGHRFPMRKYVRLRERLLEEGVLTPDELNEPPPASDEEILRCHDHDYLARMTSGNMTPREMLRIGFPWSPAMVERSRRSSGATIVAALTALEEGIAVNLAGGTHHAARAHGEGYCVFNDSPIAARALQVQAGVERVLIVDTDVHQGNGTADICRDDPTIFTFSIHGERNFPFRKVNGSLDVGLPDGTGDEDYLAMLEIALERAFFAFRPQFVLWVSGADPFVGDTLGKLALSKQGLARRDTLVLQMCATWGAPVAISMGGGYAKDVEDIVDIHLQTVKLAKPYAKPARSSLPLA
jgi:acetoin utilization deacetylase AcuC-like enzyme